MLLFSHQHNRVVTEYKGKQSAASKYDLDLKEEISDSNIPPNVPELQLSSTVKIKQAKKDFINLLGHPVASEIDKKLLFGIFERPPTKRLAKGDHSKEGQVDLSYNPNKGDN